MMLVGGMNLSQNLVDLGKQLLEACKNGETEEVKNLMQSGAPFTTDWLGASPLHFASQYGHVDVVDVLLRAGVSRDTRTKVDRTPLHVAAQEGYAEVVNMLVMNGADIDAKDLLRMTPLHWAVERGHDDVVECLLNHGADVDTVSKFDKTAIDIAYDVGRGDLVPLLQRYTNSSNNRPRNESRTNQVSNCKSSRPIVLPNKATRTAKGVKLQVQPNSVGNVKKVIVNQKTVESLKKILGGAGDADLLSSLAALASSSTNNSSNHENKSQTEEAVEWLTSQGLGSTDNDTLVESALESGQSLNLTEAGKLILNSLKTNQNSNPSKSPSEAKKKIITVVADSSKLSQIINSGSSNSKNIVVLRGVSGQAAESLKNQTAKTVKISQGINLPRLITIPRQQSPVKVPSQNVSSISLAPEDDDSEVVRSLKRQLDSCKKELEDCKKRLQEKDCEIDRLNQLLGDNKNAIK